MEIFSDLLLKYLPLHDLSQAQLARKIGVSREAVNNWVNNKCLPKRKNVMACAKALSLSDEQTTELLDAAGFDQNAVFGHLEETLFADYIRQLFNGLSYSTPPVILLLTQAGWEQPPCREALLTQARQIYSPENVLHIKPPYQGGNIEKDFAALGEQCEFNNVNDGYEFAKAFNKLLKNNNLFLLVSRFEQNGELLRERLAEMLRNLSDNNDHRLHIILSGGKKLETFKYRCDLNSWFDHAQVERWPELGHKEVYALCNHYYQDLPLDESLADDFLKISGGHPQILLECLRYRSDEPSLALNDYPKRLSQWEYLWELFRPFLDKNDSTKLCQLLDQEVVGKTQLRALNPLVNQLYWKNLLTECERDGQKSLRWRCQALQAAGKAFLCQKEEL